MHNLAMNSLMPIFNNAAVMTSREIAELVGKRHDHVLRDIRVMVEKFLASPKLGWHCVSTTYVDEQGKPREMFELDKDTTLTLISGYDPVVRFKIIKRWQELEANTQTSIPAIGSTYSNAHLVFDALFKVCQLIGLDTNAAAISSNNAVVRKIGINLLEEVGQAKLPSPNNVVTLTPTDIGKSIGLSAREVNKKLECLGLQYLLGKVWVPTEAGKQKGARVIDSSKKNSKGAMIQQLRWSQNILVLLTDGV